MPIDPNIAMGVRPVQTPNMLGQYAQAQELTTNALKMQEYQRGLGEQNALRELIKSGVDLKSPEARKKMYEISPEMGYSDCRLVSGLGGQGSHDDLEHPFLHF